MQIYKEEADKLGISLLDCPHSERDFSLTSRPGDYRYIMHKPIDIEYRLLEYSDPDQDLMLTQLEQLEGRQLESGVKQISEGMLP